MEGEEPELLRGGEGAGQEGWMKGEPRKLLIDEMFSPGFEV